MTPEFRARVEAVVGADRVRWDRLTRYAYALDGTAYEGRSIPEGAVLVESEEEVAGVMAACAAAKVPVVARGGGSSLSGAPLATAGGLVMDFSRMDRIVRVDPANAVVVCEPGVNCDALNEALGEHGFFFPPDPGSSGIATIGGMVANNSGGVQALKYGVTKDYVLWVDVVLADGARVRFGSKVLKSSSSYNLAGLFVGSEGELGLVTRVGLKIRPLPQARKTGYFIFEALGTACQAAVAVRVAGQLPNMLELLDARTTRECFDYLGVPADEIPRGNLLLLECDGHAAAVEAIFAECERAIRRHEPLFVKIAEAPGDREEILQARKAALPALSRSAPTASIEDCTVPITAIPGVIAQMEALRTDLAPRGVELAVFGHVGDGNLHPTFLYNGTRETQRLAFREGLERLYAEIVAPVEGSITGEHGVGTIKAPFVALEHGAASAWMRRVKTLFDPDHLLNPGKGKGDELAFRARAASPTFAPYHGPHTAALQCMRCGFCVRSCPAWLEETWEPYSPRGKMSLVRGLLNHDIAPDGGLQRVFLACTLCGACAAKCPAGLETHAIFEQVRDFLHDGGLKP